jgi:hypothetical protein
LLGFHLRVTKWESCRAPVADSAIFAGEFVALLVIVTLPIALPASVGANTSLSVVDCVGVRVTPAIALLLLNPAPETRTLEIVTFEFPWFVTVTSDELLLSIFTGPKFTLDGFAPSRKVASTPVPPSGIVNGESVPLLTRETQPTTLPETVGANITSNVALRPEAIVSGKPRPAILKPLPETLALEIVTLLLPVLLSRTGCELVVPMTTFPKLALDGIAERDPSTPVPVPPNAIVTRGSDALLAIVMLPFSVPRTLGAK